MRNPARRRRREERLRDAARAGLQTRRFSPSENLGFGLEFVETVRRLRDAAKASHVRRHR